MNFNESIVSNDGCFDMKFEGLPLSILGAVFVMADVIDFIVYESVDWTLSGPTQYHM